MIAPVVHTTVRQIAMAPEEIESRAEGIQCAACRRVASIAHALVARRLPTKITVEQKERKLESRTPGVKILKMSLIALV